jgi:nucleoside-diphosphate-sugar epimerase
LSRRVLITGGTGFVGSHAIEIYAAAGWEVRALVRNPSRKAWSEQCNAEVCVGALHNPADLSAAVAGCEVVVHCAGVTKTARRDDYYRINRDAVGLLAQAARAAGVKRFVLCSTHAASGPALDGIASREDDPPRPLTDYGRSKLEGEQVLKDNAGAMEWVILRPPSILGPRDEQFIPLFRGVVRYGIYPRFGAGGQAYSYIYVKDFARALLMAGEAQSGLCDTYFVAHPENLDWAAAAATIAKAAHRRVRVIRIPESVLRVLGELNDLYATVSGKPALLSSDKVKEILARPWVCSTEKIQRVWNFRCEYSTEQALRETLDFYRRTRRL